MVIPAVSSSELSAIRTTGAVLGRPLLRPTPVSSSLSGSALARADDAPRAAGAGDDGVGAGAGDAWARAEGRSSFTSSWPSSSVMPFSAGAVGYTGVGGSHSLIPPTPRPAALTASARENGIRLSSPVRPRPAPMAANTQTSSAVATAARNQGLRRPAFSPGLGPVRAASAPAFTSSCSMLSARRLRTSS